jgi:hypothetical protein
MIWTTGIVVFLTALYDATGIRSFLYSIMNAELR